MTPPSSTPCREGNEAERFVAPKSRAKLAACLERVADDHSGCFSQEDAFVIECAIAALRARGATA